MSNKNNIIQFDRSYKECRHTRYLIDPDLAYVTCRDCGKELNPMYVIRQLANEEHILNMNLKSMREQIKKAEKKNRCKCEHCGKMTHIQRD